MAEFYVKSGQATERVNSTAYSLGAKMVLSRSDTSTNYTVVRKWVWECTTAGTSSSALPTWPSTVTQDTTTITDGTVVWTARKPGFSSGTTPNWTYAHPFLDWVATAITAGDVVYISSSHVESYAAGYSFTAPGTQVNPNLFLSVNDSAAPPTSLAIGASITTTGSFSIDMKGSIYWYGVTLDCAVSGAASMWLAGNDNEMTFENCKLRLSSNQNSQRINFGSGGNGPNAMVKLINTSLKFGTTSQRIVLYSCRLEWLGGSLESGTSAIDNLFEGPDEIGIARLESVDLSAMTSGAVFIASPSAMFDLFAKNCKTPATFDLAWSAPSQARTRLISLATSSANSVNQYTNWGTAGKIVQETTIKKTGGSAVSFKMSSSSNAKLSIPLVSQDIIVNNTTVGSSVTFTVDVLTDNVTLTDKECWLEVLSYSTAGSPMLTYTNDGIRSTLATGTAQTTSSATWTTTGLTTPVKQKLEVTVTPQVAGDVICRVYLVKPSTVVYIDPQVVVS